MSSSLARIAATEFSRYFRHLARGWNGLLGLWTEDQLWTKPFPFGNSIGHLILHLTGNLNHYIGALDRRVGLRPPSRARVHRPNCGFLGKSSWPVSSGRRMVVQTLEAQDEASFAASVPDQPPIQTRLGLFLVCAAHMNNHIGQMSYLVQALQASTNEPPVW